MFFLFAALMLPATAASIALRPYRWYSLLPGLALLALANLLLQLPLATLPGYLALALAVAISRNLQGWRAGVGLLCCLLIALLLAFKVLPVLPRLGPVASQQLSATSGTWHIYGGLNKALIGLLLLPLVQWPQLRWRALVRAWPLLLGGPLLVALLAWLLGLAPDYKLSPFTALFVLANLCFVVINEEIFFRGLIQSGLQKALAKLPAGEWLGLGLAAVIFGLLHFAGGSFYVLLATVAGLLYGLAYWQTRSLWAGVFTHLMVNTLHFVFLQYPVPG